MRILLFVISSGFWFGSGLSIQAQNILNMNGYLYTYPKFYPGKTDKDAMGFKGNVKSVKTINFMWDTVTVVKEVRFRADGNLEKIIYSGLEQKFSEETFYYDSNGRLDSISEIKSINNMGLVGYGTIQVKVFVRKVYSYLPDLRKRSEYSFVYTEGVDSAEVDSSFMEEKFKNDRIIDRTYYRYNKKGEKSSSTDTYTFLDKEHLITEGTGSYKTYYCFNATNKLLTKYYTEGKEKMAQTFSFNSFGDLIKVVSIASPYLPTTTSEFSNTYDATGNITKWIYTTNSTTDATKKGIMGKQKYIIEYY